MATKKKSSLQTEKYSDEKCKQLHKHFKYEPTNALT